MTGYHRHRPSLSRGRPSSTVTAILVQYEGKKIMVLDRAAFWYYWCKKQIKSAIGTAKTARRGPLDPASIGSTAYQVEAGRRCELTPRELCCGSKKIQHYDMFNESAINDGDNTHISQSRRRHALTRSLRDHNKEYVTLITSVSKCDNVRLATTHLPGSR